MTKNTVFASSDHRNFNRDGQHFNVGETFAGLRFNKGVELAEDLKYTGDMNDSASMNMWLHKEVMRRLAENGGKVPADLLN